MKSRNLIVLLIVFGILFTGFKQQQDNIKQLLDNFALSTEDAYQEKVYLHTDKPYYAIGDEIWFKAYILNAKNLYPTSKSDLMIVELINSNNKLYKRIKVPLVGGTGWGNFTLADSLHEGNYRIRAYTNWMRNFDQDLYYDKIFKVGDARSSQLIINASYSFSKSGEDDLVNAKINYSNMEGLPYGNKNVNYSVVIGDQIIAKGKSVTNQTGDITIGFKTKNSDIQKNGLIKSSLIIAERTIVNKNIPLTKTSNDIDVKFFPEGGDLVNNIRSKVAFKAIGRDGLGKAISGIVKSDKGEVLAQLDTKHKGMGFFYLTPVEGAIYSAKVDFSDGSSKEFLLPKAKEEGVVLNILSTQKDSIVVRVLGNVPASKQENNYTIIAQSSGNLIYSIKSKISTKGGFFIRLSKSEFPTGICQFTLFDNNMQPVAERLLFIDNQKTYLNLDIKTAKSSYKQREEVELQVSSFLPGKSNIGTFSVSVTDEDKVPVNENEEHTILSELLLNSDLKGFIEEPNYYFNNINAKRMENLDVLMLTQGWRRFKWENIINYIKPNFLHNAENTLAIKGKVMNNKKPIPNANLIIMRAKSRAVLQAKANSKGEFYVDSLLFPDSTKFVIQARSEKGKKFVDIIMDNQFDDVISPNNQSSLNENINASMSAYLKSSKTKYEELLKYGLASRSIMLNEVTVVEQKKKEIEDSSNLNGPGNADNIISGDELQNAPTLEFALMGRVPGLNIRDGIAYFTRNGGKPALIILDGMHLDDSAALSYITPQDIETIEILRNISYTAIYGGSGSGGVIVITTKKGSGGFSNAFAPGIITYSPLGLFVTKEFYMPAYDKLETNKNMADLRSTVYWNPTVITDTGGKAKVKFFNADGKGNHRVVIEGIDLEGHIGRKVIRYTVN